MKMDIFSLRGVSPHSRRRRSFILIELLIVIAIIAIEKWRKIHIYCIHIARNKQVMK